MAARWSLFTFVDVCAPAGVEKYVALRTWNNLHKSILLQ
jgi:hypothetical protein